MALDKVDKWFLSVHAVHWDISATGFQRESLPGNEKSDGVFSVIPFLMFMPTITLTTSSEISESST